MDFGERQGFEATEAQASEHFDAPVHAALPDIPELIPPPPGSLPPAPVTDGFNLRAATAIAFSGAVHAGALGLFIFLAPPVNEQPEVLEIPIEVVGEPLEAQLLEVAVQPELAPQEAPTPAPEMAVEPPAAAETQPEPVAEPARESEPVVAEKAPEPEPLVEPEPVVTREPETQVAALEPRLSEPPPEVTAPAIAAPPPVVVPPPKAVQPKRVEPPKAEAPKRDEPRKPPPKREVEERKPEPRRVVEERKPATPAAPVRTASLPPPAAKPLAPAAPAPSAASIGAWRSGVASRIAGNKSYPESARSRAAAGTAVVSLSIAAGGQLAGASISSSSGHADLDAASLSAVRRAAPFPPPPPGAPRSLAVPFRYGLR